MFRRRKESLEELLDRIEGLVDREDLHGARKAVDRARRQHPAEPEILEWDACLTAEEERFPEALAILEQVLAREPGRPFARRERCSVLMEMGRFEEALEALRGFLRDGLPGDALEEAGVRYDMGCCLDRLRQPGGADAEHRRAAALAPAEYPVPPRMAEKEFDALVAAALDSIPARFHPYLRQVSVAVRDYPPSDAPGPFILGLYSGVPRTERTQEVRDNLDTVFIFKRNHELLGLSPPELREEVRKTVVHELAHHFGMGEDEMGDYA